MSRTWFNTIILVIIMSFLFTGMTYYIIYRRMTLFGVNTSNKIRILVISFIITIIIISLFLTQQHNDKIVWIIWSIASRFFMLIPILAILMGIQQLIQKGIFHIINPNKLTEIKSGWIITLIVFVALFAYGFYTAFNTKITNVQLTSNKITKDVNIMLVSDLHVDDIISTRHIKEIKKQILKQKPDVVLIAWDLFNRAKIRQAEYFKVLTWIDIPILAIAWNHDIMWDINALNHVVELTNIRFLQNEIAVLKNFNIQIIGLEEEIKWKNKNNNETKSLQNIIKSANMDDNSTFNILMTHQPIHLTKINDLPIDLEVAWHVHKMQIRGLHFISYLINDYTYWYQKLGNQEAFITQWIGTRWLPIRLWTKSEIVMLHIKKLNK